MNSEPDEPALFDLPLAPPGLHEEPHAADPAARRSRVRAGRPESLPLFDEADLDPREAPARASRPVYEPIPREVPANPKLELVPAPAGRDGEDQAGPAPAALGPRVRSAVGDLIVLGAVAAIAASGARLLGGSLAARDLPALGAFLLAFSFLYCVVSLAFWGQTPGMAWTGLVARTDETEPLSFGQTAMRWLGHWLTWAFLGLPALLAAVGERRRSLADRISGSETYELASRG
jgi:uncharacterized RDD family membrane protein YckC